MKSIPLAFCRRTIALTLCLTASTAGLTQQVLPPQLSGGAHSDVLIATQILR